MAPLADRPAENSPRNLPALLADERPRRSSRSLRAAAEWKYPSRFLRKQLMETFRPFPDSTIPVANLSPGNRILLPPMLRTRWPQNKLPCPQPDDESSSTSHSNGNLLKSSVAPIWLLKIGPRPLCPGQTHVPSSSCHRNRPR